MDCETFDRDVVDLLYGEGETSALVLHAETCPRCAETLATLRSGRDLAARLPRVSPPEGLSRRILAAAERPRESATFSRRVARAASWAGSLAMRPQFAMAALFCLAVGSSLLLLRARTDSLPGPTSVREAGLPAPELALPEASPAAKSARRPEGDRGDERSLEAAPAAPAAASPPSAPADAKEDGASGPQPALDAALARLGSAGCAGALAELRAVAAAFPGTPQAERAGREVETCVGPLAVRTPAAAPPPAATPPSAGGAVASGAKAPPAKGSATPAASASAAPR